MKYLQLSCCIAISLCGISCNSNKGTKRQLVRIDHEEKYYDKIYTYWDTSLHFGAVYYIKGQDTVFVKDPMMPPPPPKN